VKWKGTLSPDCSIFVLSLHNLDNEEPLDLRKNGNVDNVALSPEEIRGQEKSRSDSIPRGFYPRNIPVTNDNAVAVAESILSKSEQNTIPGFAQFRH
jgi:hypothetical protein